MRKISRRTTRFCGATVLLGIAILSAGATANASPEGDAGTLVTVRKLNWRTAEKLASEAVRLCEQRGYSVTASVVDPSGHQQAVVKGDDAALQTLSVSYRKAYTAFSYGKTFNKNTTSELIKAKVTGPLDGGVLATEPEIIFIAGGVTLRTRDGGVIGGIGVSGAPGGDKDEACAADAVAALKESFH
jgi:uncharacterized protein GlcG (DUF336 family)